MIYRIFEPCRQKLLNISNITLEEGVIRKELEQLFIHNQMPFIINCLHDLDVLC